MYIDLRQDLRPSSLCLRQYGLCFHGPELDERGRSAVRELSHRSSVMYTVEYSGRSMRLMVNNVAASSSDLRELVSQSGNRPIALETTTLGFVEVLLCCRAVIGSKSALDCVYVEPKRYTRSRRQQLLSNRGLLAKRDFELSGEIVGFRGIPGAARMLNDRRHQKYVFFLGYEGERFMRAFSDLEMLNGRSANVVFGVPAFKPGWEMDSIANNISVMRDNHVSGVYFCGANNPRAAIEVLSATYDGLEFGETMFVAPLGTKPHGIATALFVAKHKSVGVIYDHPDRVRDRSESVGKWHLFSVADLH